jgi:WD40 repeat protein
MVMRDGRVVTRVDGGATEIRDPRTLRPLQRLGEGNSTAALSPDDRTLVLASHDGAVRFVDVATGRTRTGTLRHDGVVLSALFSSDGRRAVTAGEGGRAIVWDVATAAPDQVLDGAGVILGAALSHDGKTLYTAATNGTIIVWDIAGDRRLGRLFDAGPGVPVAEGFRVVSRALSPDGRTLAVGKADGTVRLIDAHTLRERSRFHATPVGPVRGMAYMPGGRLLAVGGEDGFLALFDPRDGALVQRLEGHTQWVGPPSFSADGRLMATFSPSSVQVRKLRAGRPVDAPPLKISPSQLGGAGDAALSPDGKTLAVANGSSVAILDPATMRLRGGFLQTSSPPWSVRFTPDGRLLIVGVEEGSAQLWSTRTWRSASRPLGGHRDAVLAMSVSPDGDTLATGSWDGTVRLFDLATRQSLGPPIRGVPNRAIAPEFSPDGRFLFTLTDAGQAARWDMRPASWKRFACAVAGRRLTRAEWEDVLPGRDYAPACG